MNFNKECWLKENSGFGFSNIMKLMGEVFGGLLASIWNEGGPIKKAPMKMQTDSGRILSMNKINKQYSLKEKDSNVDEIIQVKSQKVSSNDLVTRLIRE